MNATQRILLPTDFSREAGQALHQAVVLADRLGAELHLLHVVTGPTSLDGGMIGFSAMEEYGARMRAEAARHHRGLLEPRRAGDLPVRCAVRRHTEAARAILEYAADHRIDLIVMAPYGRSQGGRFVVGSTAEKVMRLARCDVMTSGLRGLYRPDMLRRILVPVDLSPQSAHALERARVFASQARARLKVLHVVEARVFPGSRPGEVIVEAPQSDEAYAELERFYRSTKGPDVPHTLSVVRGRPADQIATVADRDQIHLIIQGSRGRSGVDYAMLGSVAEVVVRLAPCPVLTVKAPAGGSQTSTATRQRARTRPEEPSRVPAMLARSLKTEVAT